MKLPAHRAVRPLKLDKFLRSIETRNSKGEVVHLVNGKIVASIPTWARAIDFFIIEINYPENLIQPYMIVRRESLTEHVFRYQRSLIGCQTHLYKLMAR